MYRTRKSAIDAIRKVKMCDRKFNEFKNDKDFCKVAVKVNPQNLKLLSDEMRNDEEIVLLALKSEAKHTKSVMEYVGDKLKCDKEFARKAIEINPMAFESFGIEIRSDEYLANKAIEDCPDMMDACACNLTRNREFILRNVHPSHILTSFQLGKELSNDVMFLHEVLQFQSKGLGLEGFEMGFNFTNMVGDDLRKSLNARCGENGDMYSVFLSDVSKYHAHEKLMDRVLTEQKTYQAVNEPKRIIKI